MERGPAMSANSPSLAGLTVPEVARLLRVGTDKVRSWIRAGHLGAINTASTQCGKPRFVVLPFHLEEFIRRRSAAPVPKPARRRKRIDVVDYFADLP
jgi:excisionase family DNA binding protein